MASASELVDRLNRGNTQPNARLRFVSELPFGETLAVRQFELGNGLTVLTMVDRAAPVVSYHSWFRVGSRHEQPGKTGLAHLFEHLMFKATKNHPQGDFDRLMEEAGAENNAATWTDWTCYYENLPAHQLELAVRLESDRLENLVLDDEQVSSEKEVVQNERRYTVDDDVDGSAQERLWAEALSVHPYRWPTIGWMQDIESFTVDDCVAFYRTWYAPNNNVVVVVGDIDDADVLAMVQRGYGHLPPSELPELPQVVEPARQQERRVVHPQPTDTEKLHVAWPAPAYAAKDHGAVAVVCDILASGRSSRLYRELVFDRELATDVGMSASPFRDPGLTTLSAGARQGHRAAELLAVVDAQLERIQRDPPSEAELEKVKNRLELGFLTSLETASGKADQVGFCAVVVDDPAAVFERLRAYREVTAAQVSEAARRWLGGDNRTIVEVVPAAGSAK